jgi:hypothetical protein
MRKTLKSLSPLLVIFGSLGLCLAILLFCVGFRAFPYSSVFIITSILMTLGVVGIYCSHEQKGNVLTVSFFPLVFVIVFIASFSLLGRISGYGPKDHRVFIFSSIISISLVGWLFSAVKKKTK